mgnify:CR=1 FL=1
MSYAKGIEQFHREMEQRERDAAYATNRALLAAHYRVGFDSVMDALRRRPREGKIVIAGSLDSPTFPERDVKDAPANLSDRQLAEWLVKKLRDTGQLSSVSSSRN